MFRIHYSKAMLAALALAICTGTLQANITAPTTLALTCDTLLGPGPAVPLAVALTATGSSVTVTATAPAGPVVLPAPASVGPTTAAVNFNFSVAPGCKGATNNQQVVITLTPAGGTAITTTATLTITNSASALAPSPSAVAITCTKSGASYTPGSAQTVNVTSPANGGTPFTVDNTTNPLPGWLSVTPLTGGTAAATAIQLSVVAKSGCGALPVGSTSFSVHLLNPPAPDKQLPVTIQIGAAASLAATVSPVALSYTKASGVYTAVTTDISASPAAFFTVDPNSLPIWMNVTPTSGTTTSPVTLSFVPTGGAETLALGGYSGNVRLKVSGALDFVVPVTLQVKNPAATLTVSEGISRSINWTIGTDLPTLLITPISTDSPISYGVTTSGALTPQVSQTKGLAYSFGSPFAVTFLQAVFGAATPGSDLVGHVIITPATGDPVDVTITVHVKSPGAVITSISPSVVPTATSGTVTVGLSGTGFVASTDPLLKTKVGIVSGGLIVTDLNVAATVNNASSIILVITVPASADPYLPFSGAGGTVSLGVCNPQGATCSTPTGTATLTIGVNPIVQAVTSASSFIESTSPALTPIAPYDILSIFGTNFCVSGGTGCTGGGSLLYGTTDPLTLRYLTSVSPDAVSGTQRKLSVTFQTHAATPVAIGTAALLFATNNQINLVVPDAVKNYIGNTVDIVVSFGYNSGATMLKSAPYSVTVAATNPGVFAIGSNGLGDAAALLSPSYALVSSAKPAASRSTSTDSDIIQLYVTGLGRPDSDGTGTGYSATCMAVDTYWGNVNTATAVSPALTSADGLVVQFALLPSATMQPCVKVANAPVVTIGNIGGLVKYAGWVADSVAGLYQINVQLPASTSSFIDATPTTGPVLNVVKQMPIVVTMAGKSSQASGVNLSVIRRLQVTGSGAVTGTSGNVWGASAVTATEGVATTFTYVATTGTLPAGLTLDADTGAIAGTPTTPGVSTVLFTATETGSGLTGTVSVTFTVTAP